MVRAWSLPSCCFLRQGTLFYIQVYKRVPAIIMRCTSIPSGESSNIASCFILQQPELSAGLMGHLARKQTSSSSFSSLSFFYLTPLYADKRPSIDCALTDINTTAKDYFITALTNQTVHQREETKYS